MYETSSTSLNDNIFENDISLYIGEESILFESSIVDVELEASCRSEADKSESEIGLDLEQSFKNFVSFQEKKFFRHTLCQDFFDITQFPECLKDVVKMNKVDLWELDCAYGLLFQAFVARELNLDLPCPDRRKRKQPIREKKNKHSIKQKFFFEEDPIYREILHGCNTVVDQNRKRKAPRKQILLHIFIIDLLLHPYYNFCIGWDDLENLEFTVKDSRAIARIWMIVKENDTCNFEHLARAIRFRRKNGTMFTSTKSKRKRVYKLTKTAILDYRKKKNKNKLALKLFYKTFHNFTD